MKWLSKQVAASKKTAPLSAEGVVSIGGGEPAVVTDGEVRGAAVVSPGGYQWQPQTDETVLVLRASRECVVGTVRGEKGDLAPGEVRISGGGASICLRRGGRIELTGDVYVNGRELVL